MAALRADHFRDNREVWKEQNEHAIHNAVHEILSLPRPKKDGLIYSHLLTLINVHTGEEVKARMDYETAALDNPRSNSDTYQGRLSIYPASYPLTERKLPDQGTILRTDEIASLDAFLVLNESETQLSAQHYVNTSAEWQQNGISKALLVGALEPLSIHVAQHWPNLAKMKQMHVLLRDKSQGRDGLQLEGWTTKIVEQWNAERPAKDRFSQIQPGLYQKLITFS